MKSLFGRTVKRYRLAALCAGLLCALVASSAVEAQEILASSTLVSGLQGPSDAVADPAGDIYFTDGASVEEVVAVQGVIPAHPQIITVSNQFVEPTGLAMDPAGNLYVSDWKANVVQEIVAVNGSIPQNPQIRTLASGFNSPNGIALDANGNLFVADQYGGGGIKEILAVNGSIPDGASVIVLGASSVIEPGGVAVDASGNVYATDMVFGSLYVIRAVNGSVSPNSEIDPLNSPENPSDSVIMHGLAIGKSGVLYVSTTNNGLYAVNLANNSVAPISGSFFQPSLISMDSKGNVLVADTVAKTISRIATTDVEFGQANLCSGTQGTAEPCSQQIALTYTLGGNFTGTAKVLTQGLPGLDFTAAQTISCTANNGNSVCSLNVQFTPKAAGPRSGAVQIVDGSGNTVATTFINGIGVGPQIAFGPGIQTTIGSGFVLPQGVAVDAGGDTWIADIVTNRVVKVTPAGVQTTVGSGLSYPLNVALDGAGDVFISQSVSNSVIEVTPAGVQSAVGNGLGSPTGVAVDGAGDVFIADVGNKRVVKVTPSGVQSTVVGSLSEPAGIAVDGAGDLFVSLPGNNHVVEVTPAGTQTTIGSGLNYPTGVAVDGAGDVFIADGGNNRVVEVMPSGLQTTIGSGLDAPSTMALDGAGDVFIADYGNNRVVEVQRSQAPTLSFASTNVGSTSTDSPQSVTIQNIGNTPLTASGLSVASNFEEVDGSGTPEDCTASFSLTPGAACNLSISFAPLSGGSISGQVVLTDNAMNANPAMQSIALSGTGQAVPPVITSISPAQGPPSGGTSVTITGPGMTGAVAVEFGANTAASFTVVNATTIVATTPPGSGTVDVTVTTPAGTSSTGAADQFTYVKATAQVTLSNLSQTYTGSALQATATTSPAGLTVSLTYNGSSTVPVSAGSYTVVATINDANYQGTATGTLLIAPAIAKIALGNLNQTYTGSALPATATTTPAGLAVSLSYNGSASVPVSAGSYAVVATVNNQNYQGSTTGTLVINPAPATVTLGNLNQTYTGSALPVTATTNPAGLTVSITYNGSASVPSAVGSYAVVATVSNPNYKGTATGALVINPAYDTAIDVRYASTQLVYPGATNITACIAPSHRITATGAVQIYDGAKLLTTQPVQGGGCAYWYISPGLAAGTHSLTVAYSGDRNNPGGKSAPTILNVAPVAVNMSPSCWLTNSGYGANYQCTVSLSSNAGPPEGVITYSLDGAPTVTVPINYGKADFTLTKPDAGGHSLVIAYAQQTNYAAARPVTEKFTVAPAAVYVALTPSSWYAKASGDISFEAAVNSSSAGAPSNNGSVSFYDGRTLLGTIPVDGGGRASYQTATLTAGIHTITATYSGGTNYASGSSTVVVTLTK